LKEGAASQAWTRAQKSLATARLLHPTSPALHALLGETYLAQGNLSRAAESFSISLKAEPGRVDALHGLARVALQRGNPTEAESHLLMALERNPQQWGAAYNFGVYLYHQGRHVDAEKRLRKSAQLAGEEEASPHAALAQLYLATDQPTRALVEASLATSREYSALNHTLRGKAFYEVDQLDAAFTAFQEAILLDPSHWPARAGMGLIHARRGEYARCAQAMRGVLVADPGNPAATENLRRCEDHQEDG